MRNLSLSMFLALAVVLLSASVVDAQIHGRIPQDGQPPQYTGGAGPGFQTDGSLFAVHDSDWAVIPFWRSTTCIPANFNLLDQFDPNAESCELLISGFAKLQAGTFLPMSWEVRAVSEVPVWFVSWAQLQTAMADGVLTMNELSSLDTLIVGTATFYQEQNHTFFGHQVSHLSLRASGSLEDGRSFRVGAVEVALGLIQVNIDFH